MRKNVFIVITGLMLVSASALALHTTPLLAQSITELTSGATITNVTSANALSIRQNTDVGDSRSEGGAVLIDNSGNANTGLTLYTDQGNSATQPLMRMEVDNPDFNEEVLYIHSDSPTSRGLIRLDSPAPEIEFVETDQSGAQGKFEVRVQHGEFQINSRRPDDTTFEKKVTMTQSGDLELHGGDITLIGGCVRVNGNCIDGSGSGKSVPAQAVTQSTNKSGGDATLSSGEPDPIACNSYTERGAMVFDYEQNRLYVCAGPDRGWDYTALND